MKFENLRNSKKILFFILTKKQKTKSRKKKILGSWIIVLIVWIWYIGLGLGKLRFVHLRHIRHLTYLREVLGVSRLLDVGRHAGCRSFRTSYLVPRLVTQWRCALEISRSRCYVRTVEQLIQLNKTSTMTLFNYDTSVRSQSENQRIVCFKIY